MEHPTIKITPSIAKLLNKLDYTITDVVIVPTSVLPHHFFKAVLKSNNKHPEYIIHVWCSAFYVKSDVIAIDKDLLSLTSKIQRQLNNLQATWQK